MAMRNAAAAHITDTALRAVAARWTQVPVGMGGGDGTGTGTGTGTGSGAGAGAGRRRGGRRQYVQLNVWV
ncbi:hypothetical protein [Streptomyces sp. 6N223]|uniref:hypothetical protein n=1 Tax=Streptomyces sp. 6N223 TaxID=3457412 RepID=UPI003FCFCE7E